MLDQTVVDLIKTMQPALDRAAKLGLLVGGQLRVCQKINGSWKPVRYMTITRTDPPDTELIPVMVITPPELPHLESSVAVLTGETCFKCGGARMQRSGTCTVCLDCGESGGCG